MLNRRSASSERQAGDHLPRSPLAARCSLALLLLITFDARRRIVKLPEFDNPDAAANYFAMKRGITSNFNPHRRYDAARAAMANMDHIAVNGERLQRGRLVANATPTNGPWTFLGPGNIGGRTRPLLIDPHDTNVLYAGAVSGGVWKTINGGGEWFAVGDQLANLAVNSLAFDPDDARVIYAGTGEGYFREEVRGTALPIQGDGIFVTRDAGASWSRLASTTGDDFAYVNDLVVSTHDARRIYAATRSGVWRSSDRGASWTRVLATTVKGGCLDLAFRGYSDGDFLFASCGTFERATIYRSKRAEENDTWEPVLTDAKMGRTSLAVAPSNPSTIYALAANNSNDQALLAVFRSDRDGDAGSWTTRVRYDTTDVISSLLLTNAIAARMSECLASADVRVNTGWYSNVIAVDPVDPERVWAAGVDLYRSDDGGATWRLASYWWPDTTRASFVHADQHAIVFDPHYDGASNQTLYATNDGGIFRTRNARASIDPVRGSGACEPDSSLIRFEPLNHHYGVTQFYHGVVLPGGKGYLAGAQDNGTTIGNDAAGVDGWRMIYPGDGGYVAYDAEGNSLYAEYQWAQFARSDDGGANWARALYGLSDQFLFITPFALDPHVHTRVWLGGTRIWRSDDRGQAWTASSRPIDGFISALALTSSQQGLMLAGTTNGEILRMTNVTNADDATTWPSTTPRGGFVSSITIDPANPNIAYATYAGFGGGAHVWRSLDAGVSWLPLGDLPDLPIHSLALYRNRIFLGTDLGVFVSLDNGATWAVDSSFPAVITESLSVSDDSLYAFTHGRGAWRAPLNVRAQRRRAAAR